MAQSFAVYFILFFLKVNGFSSFGLGKYHFNFPKFKFSKFSSSSTLENKNIVGENKNIIDENKNIIGDRVRTLLIDNFDSYTFNIWQYLAEINLLEPKVVFNNNKLCLTNLISSNFSQFDNIVLSPGPGTVLNRDDFGICEDIIKFSPIPVFGVCLGHQGIGNFFGGKVVKAPAPVHGRLWRIVHDGKGLFEGVGGDTQVVRYHSLIVSSGEGNCNSEGISESKGFPDCLEVNAKTPEGHIMALKHKTRPLYGVQFHPESIGTTCGKQIFKNFKRITLENMKKTKIDKIISNNPPSISNLVENKKKLRRNVLISNKKKLFFRNDTDIDPLEYVFQELFSSRNISFWLDNCSLRNGSLSNSSSFSFLGTCGDDSNSKLTTSNSVEYYGSNCLITRFSNGTTVETNDNIFSYLNNQIRNQNDNFDINVCTSDSDILNDNSYLRKEIVKGSVLFGFLGYEARFDATSILLNSNSTFDTSSQFNMSITSSSSLNASKTPISVFLNPSQYLVCDHMSQSLYVVSIQDFEENNNSNNSEKQSLSNSQHIQFEREVDNVLNKYIVDENIAKREFKNMSKDNDYLVSNVSEKEYKESISKCMKYISDGESYELCLTTQFSGSLPQNDKEISNPFNLYKTLRRKNPAPYSSFFHYHPKGFEQKFSICCSSPECFLKVNQAGEIESKPIKGTVKRNLVDSSRDLELRNELEHDEKSRAENLMIVDLVRHDLGRVCEVGSVKVPKLMSIETYATVHQMVSTIGGKLRRGLTTADLLVSSFPGGSMTGAPKTRTMELIHALERKPRGAYSGALGFIALDGSADLNIVIRTLLIAGNGSVSLGAGGAIVAMSDPQQEVDEVILKASAVGNAFGLNVKFAE